MVSICGYCDRRLSLLPRADSNIAIRVIYGIALKKLGSLVKYWTPPPVALNGASGVVQVSRIGAAVERKTGVSAVVLKSMGERPAGLIPNAGAGVPGGAK
jgi:hypothetical protein